MANFEIPSNPEYTEQIRKFETKDPAHADLFNAVIGALLSNDVFLKLAVNAAFQQATGYTDQQIADLINGAPETLNTLGEIAEAMKNNSDVVAALNAAIGTKASQAEVDGHIGNDTIHIKASERENWNDKQTKTGDVQNNIVTFESGDAVEPTGWENVALVTTKEKVSSLMRKFSLTVKNMRYLFKLIGNNQLSVGDGTLTGAINVLNTSLGNIRVDTLFSGSFGNEWGGVDIYQPYTNYIFLAFVNAFGSCSIVQGNRMDINICLTYNANNNIYTDAIRLSANTTTHFTVFKRDSMAVTDTGVVVFYPNAMNPITGIYGIKIK